MRRVRRGLPAVLAAALAALSPDRPLAKPARPSAECAPASVSADAIEAVSPEGDVRLASGRVVTLEGVYLADDPHRAPALAWLRAHVGRPVSVAAQGREPDRWARVPASLALADRPIRLDLAQGLVDQGLAVADAGERDALCAPELLA